MCEHSIGSVLQYDCQAPLRRSKYCTDAFLGVSCVHLLFLGLTLAIASFSLFTQTRVATSEQAIHMLLHDGRRCFLLMLAKLFRAGLRLSNPPLKQNASM